MQPRPYVFALIALSLAMPASAQSTILLSAGSGNRIRVMPGATLSVPIQIDASGAGGANVASLVSSLTWGATRLAFDSVKAAGFGSLTPNTTSASSGSLGLSLTSSGTTGSVTMANVYFTASAAGGGTVLGLSPSAAANSASANVLSLLRVISQEVCVGATGSWGDANADGSVNIIDAQQLARLSVGLSIANAPAANAQGDVNNDGNINIIDAQQVARFSVGLSAAARVNTQAFTAPTVANLNVTAVLDASLGGVNPGVPANLSGLPVGGQARVQPQAFDASANDVTSCATLNYASSNLSVATVNSAGVITALSPGTATITVSGQTANAIVNVVVVPGSSFGLNTWTNSSGGAWSNPNNWSLVRVPLPSDSVVISAGGTYTVNLDVNYSGGFVTLKSNAGSPTLSLSGRTLTLSGALTVGAGTLLDLVNASVVGAVTNGGSVSVQGTTSVVSLSNPAGSALTILGAGLAGNGVLNIAQPFTNFGAITMTSSGGGFTAALAASGTLINQVGGTIAAATGSGGLRDIAATLDNRGVLVVNAQTTFGTSTSTSTNSGSIAVNASLGTSGLNSTLFINTGAITVAAGQTFQVSGPSFDQTGSGSLTGLGTFSLGSTGPSAIDGTFAPGTFFALSGATVFTNAQNTTNTTWILSNATITVPSLNNTVGKTLIMQNSTINGPVANNGALIADGTSFLNGTVTTGVGSTLTVRGNGSIGDAFLTIASGFTNNGTIDFTSTGGGFNTTLVVASGTLLNAATRNITMSAGTGGLRTLNAALNNQGTITAGISVDVSAPSASHTSSGSILVNAGTFNFNQIGGGASLTTSGIVSVAAGAVFAVNSGSYSANAGTNLTGAGAFTASTVNASIGVGTTIASATFTNSTVTFGAAFTTASTALTLVNTSTSGSAITVNGNALTLRNGIVGNAVTHQGPIIAEGTSSITGVVTTTGGSLTVLGSTVAGDAILSISNASGYSNTGTIALTSSGGAFNSALNLPNGTLTNQVSGTINSQAGAGGQRTIIAALNNNGGAITVNQDLAIAKGSVAHNLSSGSITLSTGNLTVTQSGASPSWTSAIPVAVSAGRTFAVNGGTLSLAAAGNVSGAGAMTVSSATVSLAVSPTVSAVSFTSSTVGSSVALSNSAGAWTFTSATVTTANSFTNGTTATTTFTNSTMAGPLSNQGIFIAQGVSALNGSNTLFASGTVRIQGSSSVGNAALTLPGAQSNAGLIDLTSTGGGFNSSLVLSVGALTNTGTITSSVGAGGARTITARIINSNVLTVNQPLTINGTSVVHSFATTQNVNANLDITQSGGGASSTFGGTTTIAAPATLAVSGGTLTENGAIGGAGKLALSSLLSASLNTSPTVTNVDMTSVTTASLVNTTTTAGPWNIISTGITGTGTLTNGTGNPMLLRNSSIAQGFTNNGNLTAEGTSTLSTYTTVAAATLTVQGTSAGGNASLTVPSFSNPGTITLTSTGGAFNTTLSLSGILTNTSTGKVVVSPGTGGTKTLAAQLTNAGTLTVNGDLTINRSSAAHTSTGVINVNGGDLTITQTGTVSGPTTSLNSGSTTTIAGGNNITITGGAVNVNSGSSIGGAGTLVLSGTNTIFTPAHTLGGITVSNGSHAQFSLSQSSANTAWSISKSTAVMPQFTNAVGKTTTFFGASSSDSLQLSNTPGIQNNGTLNVDGIFAVTGTVTNASGATLRVRGDGSLGATPSHIDFGNTVTNLGTVEMTSVNGASNLTTNVSGTFLNQTGSTLAVLAGAGGTRGVIANNVTNAGTFDLYTTPAQSVANFSVQSLQTSANFNNGTLKLWTSCSAVSLLQFTGGTSVVMSGATLILSPIGGCTPTTATRTFATYSSRSGTGFNSVSNSIAGAGSTINYGTSAYTWMVP